jgi:hypothetical protein
MRSSIWTRKPAPKIWENDSVFLAGKSGTDGKGYVLSISAPIHYDDPDNSVQQLELNIGDNFKDITLGYWGGWTGEKPKHFEPGPIHPKQYLSAFFGYEKGQLQGFLRLTRK